MSKHENEHLNLRQNATNASSSAMRLDQATEREFYDLYKAYCRDAEEGRDTLWRTTEVPQATFSPVSSALAEAALAMYRRDIFLPDYSSSCLRLLRASRGRAWFWTRWSYEESRQLLALHDWLIAADVAEDVELKALWENTLHAERWEPPCEDAPGIFVDALLWEFSEIERTDELKTRADAENQPVLSMLMERTLRDETAQRDFLAASLKIISRRHLPLVTDALQRIAASHKSPTLEKELKTYLSLA